MATETRAERKVAYEGSALQALMESQGHEICTRCYCCDLVSTCDGLPKTQEQIVSELRSEREAWLKGVR